MMSIKRCQDLVYIFVIYETDSKSASIFAFFTAILNIFPLPPPPPWRKELCLDSVCTKCKHCISESADSRHIGRERQFCELFFVLLLIGKCIGVSFCEKKGSIRREFLFQIRGEL